MNIEKAKIYGVDKVGSSTPSALTRTDDAVGLSYTVGTTDIVSDFDRCYPWSDMQEVTDASGNVFIKIPKFYSKITKNSDGTYKHQISGIRYLVFERCLLTARETNSITFSSANTKGAGRRRVCTRNRAQRYLSILLAIISVRVARQTARVISNTTS